MEDKTLHEDSIQEELLKLIRSGLSKEELKERLGDYHDADIAAVFEELTNDERWKLYYLLGVSRISEIFSYMDDVEDYFKEIGPEISADILEGMDADDAVDVLENLPEDYREMLLSHMDDEAQEDIALISSYSDDEIGSIMTTNFILIKRGMNVKTAMKELISQSNENDNISTLYVANEDGTYYGAIDLKDLIRARQDTDLESIISTSYPTVNAHALISDELDRLRSYSEDSIPVLDDREVILGVITAFDVVEVVDDELGDDYAKLAGLTAEEDLNENLFQSIKKRIPWLIVLLILGLLVSSVVGAFSDVVSQVSIIVCFQSLILGMAGNSGTQSLAVTIRVLTDETLSVKEKLGLVFKEGRVGFSNGFLLGLTSFVLVGAYIALGKGFPLSYSFMVSACVGLSLWIAMIVAALLGTLVPMFFKKIKIDPAVASGPFITTVNDFVAVVTYYGMARILLIDLLHLGG